MYTVELLALAAALMAVVPMPPQVTRPAGSRVLEGEMSGYLLIPNERVPKTYDAGFSMYVAAWPLMRTYPGSRFQTGLPGTWMFAQYDGKAPETAYSDIEGGLGWWRDTRFATETPKFIMGGVALNFCAWANGPGAGRGRDWSAPAGHYAIAQLTPWLLWPPDGLNLKQGTSGQLVGWGYLPLPLAAPKPVTAGRDVPTGDNCWTLFLNTGNFKGPVAFFLPHFWASPTADEPRLAGMLLDSRPSDPNRALQMETQYIPAALATDSTGRKYARVAPVRFPGVRNGASAVVHRVASYNRQALYDNVKAWLDGGPEASGAIDARGEVVHVFPGHGGATWRIYAPGDPEAERWPVAWKSFAAPAAPDPHTFGYRWDPAHVAWARAGAGSLAGLPEYFRLEASGASPEWVPVAARDVPAETGLAGVRFDRPDEPRPEPYVTPEEPDSCWKKPGPAAGPFRVRLGDRSVVTYYWYRFADQPALLNNDLTEQERSAMQQRVEKIHRSWSRNRDYLAPPLVGTLADLDPALVVKPPPGMEVGYVPIVTRQEPGAGSAPAGRAKAKSAP